METEKRIDLFLKVSVIFLILLRFVLAFYYPVFSDATKYLYISKHPELMLRPDFQYFPPLEFIFGTLIYAILSDFGLKLIAPIFGALSIYYTYRLGKDIFGERKGLVAAVILGILPSHIYLSAMAYQDIVVTATATIFLYYFYRSLNAVNLKDGNIIKAGIALGFTALSKFTGVIVLPFVLLYYFLCAIKQRAIDTGLLKKCFIIICIGAVVASPYYVRELLLFGDFLGSFQLVPAKVTERYDLTGSFVGVYFNQGVLTQAGYEKTPAITDYIKEIYLDLWGIPSTDIGGVPKYSIQIYFIFSLIVTLLFLYGFFRGIREKETSHGVMVLLAWLLVWALMIAILKGQLVWGARRLLPLAPVLAIFSARGLDFAGLRSRRFLCVFLILALIIFPASQAAKAWYARDYFNKYDDSLEYIKSLPETAVVLYFDDEQALYYAEKKTYNIARLNPAYFNISTLKMYGITHVARFDGYLFYDLSIHNQIIDRMAESGELIQVWQGKQVRIYEVNY